MIKGVTRAHLRPIWYHSEPLDVPCSSNQFLDRDFFATSYSKAALFNNKMTTAVTKSKKFVAALDLSYAQLIKTL
jgi:hypothetical protein